jgi:hypothetical protein
MIVDQELAIARLAQIMFRENELNHYAGLMEEVVELMHARGIPSTHLVSLFSACMKRSYSRPSPKGGEQPRLIHGEMVDVQVMLCCVRHEPSLAPYVARDSLLEEGYRKISDLSLRYEEQPDWFAERIRQKTEEGVRFPT